MFNVSPFKVVESFGAHDDGNLVKDGLNLFQIEKYFECGNNIFERRKKDWNTFVRKRWCISMLGPLINID